MVTQTRFKGLPWKVRMKNEAVQPSSPSRVVTPVKMSYVMFSLLISDSATRPPWAVTAVTWCAAAVATTHMPRSWWSAATASTTGAAMLLARSASGSWSDTSANESALVCGHPRLQINQSTTVPRRLTFVFSMCISRSNGLFLCQYKFFIKSPNWAFELFFTSQTWMWRVWQQHRFMWRPPSSWVFPYAC